MTKSYTYNLLVVVAISFVNLAIHFEAKATKDHLEYLLKQLLSERQKNTYLMCKALNEQCSKSLIASLETTKNEAVMHSQFLDALNNARTIKRSNSVLETTGAIEKDTKDKIEKKSFKQAPSRTINANKANQNTAASKIQSAWRIKRGENDNSTSSAAKSLTNKILSFNTKILSSKQISVITKTSKNKDLISISIPDINNTNKKDMENISQNNNEDIAISTTIEAKTNKVTRQSIAALTNSDLVIKNKNQPITTNQTADLKIKKKMNIQKGHISTEQSAVLPLAKNVNSTLNVEANKTNLTQATAIIAKNNTKTKNSLNKINTQDIAPKKVNSSSKIATFDKDTDKQELEKTKQIAKTKAKPYINFPSALTHHQIVDLTTLIHHLDTLNTATMLEALTLPAAGQSSQEPIFIPLPSKIQEQDGFNPWITASHSHRIQRKMKNNYSYKTKLIGFSIGNDFALSDQDILGLYYSNISSTTQYHKSQNDHKSEAKLSTFGIYGQHNFTPKNFIQYSLLYTKGITKNQLIDSQFNNLGNYKVSSMGGAGFAIFNKVLQFSPTTFIIPRIGIRYTQNKDKNVQMKEFSIQGSKNQHLAVLLGTKIIFKKKFINNLSIIPAFYIGFEKDIWSQFTGGKILIPTKEEWVTMQSVKPNKSQHLMHNLGMELLIERRNLTLGLAYKLDLAKKHMAHQYALKLFCQI